MKKLIKNSGKKAGQIPGSLIYMGEKRDEKVRINLTAYSSKDFIEKKSINIEDIQQYVNTSENLWVNIDGIHQTGIIEEIGSIFDIHPLTLEDILNNAHRPKTEDNGQYIFIVMKMLGFERGSNSVQVEQVSLIIGKGYVISFQENETDEFEVVRDNLRKNKGRTRELGADYLSYRMLDIVIDNYFAVLEKMGELIEGLEDELIEKPTRDTLQKIYKLKNDMIIIRRAIWPLREVISGLEKTESELVSKTTFPYLRDLYDHIIQLIDTNENYREMVAAMMDIYLSSISNRLNEIMKVLTIISTFFIPLNFIAGLYGMNFNTAVSKYNMPELNYYYGYPMVIGVMLMVALILLVYFKRKKWF
ncbi:MAG: magnesium/cobalt transporter CorA [Ignavibacteriales bacterium]